MNRASAALDQWPHADRAAVPAVRRCGDGGVAARPVAAAVAVPGDGRHGRGADDRHAQPGDDRRTRRALLDRRADAVAAAVVGAVAHADRLPLRPSPLGARLAARAVHLVRHDGAVRRLRDHAVRAADPFRRHAPGRCGSATSPRRWRSCWSAAACIRFRPSASRWPPTSRRSARGPRSWRCCARCCWSAWRRSALVFGRAAAPLQRGQAHPGRAGRGGRHRRPQLDRAVEAGAAQHADRSPASAASASATPGTIFAARRARVAAWSPSRSAPPASRCRTFCSSPTAARSSNCRSAPRRR